MKKIIITLTMLLVLGMTTEIIAQKHRHTPQPSQQTTELVDSTSKDAIEAFSDTTSASSSTADDNWPFDEDDDYQVVKTRADRLFDFMDSQMSGMLFVLAVLLIIFVLSPVFIIIAVFYFINKNRKEKMRLAQMAMQQGQPIPDKLLEEQLGNDDEEYKKGIRQCFVGIGLMIFLGYAAGTVGFGVGALVFCIGLGKVFVAKTTHKSNDNRDFNNDNIDNKNNNF